MSDLLAQVSGSYRDRLRAIARAQGIAPADAEDAVQEAFARFLELGAARKIATLDEARAYLAVVVINTARNARRRHFRRKPHASIDPTLDLADDAPPIDQRIDTEQRITTLRSCIASLDDVPRKIVSLRVIGELSGSEVANSVDLSPDHVAVVLHRAKKDLCRCMINRSR